MNNKGCRQCAAVEFMDPGPLAALASGDECGYSSSSQDALAHAPHALHARAAGAQLRHEPVLPEQVTSADGDEIDARSVQFAHEDLDPGRVAAREQTLVQLRIALAHVVDDRALQRREIAALPGELVVGVQMSDGPRQPENADYYTDCLTNRLPPGKGEFDLAGFIDVVRSTGSTAPWSLEVCSARGWADPADHVTRCARGLRDALAVPT